MAEGEITISMGNAAWVAVVAVGDVILSFHSGRFYLRDVLYIPEFRRNLISISKIHLDGYNVLFDGRVTISKNNDVICSGTMINSLTLSLLHMKYPLLYHHLPQTVIREKILLK